MTCLTRKPAAAAALCSAENVGGTDGEPQGGSSETAEPTPRWDRAEAERQRPAQRVPTVFTNISYHFNQIITSEW